MSQPLKDLMDAKPGKIVKSSPIPGTFDYTYTSRDSLDPANWGLIGPEGKNNYGGPVLFFKHKIEPGDYWEKVAHKYDYTDVKQLIRENFFGIDDPPRVNWFMERYLGCTQTRDGKNYSFSPNDRPGIIWVRRAKASEWPPVAKEPPEDPNPAPREVPIEEAIRMGASHRNFPLGRPGEVARVGQVWRAVRDERMILHVSNAVYPSVYYMVVRVMEPGLSPTVGKVYFQSYKGFQQDLSLAWAADAGRRTRAIQKVMQTEMHILMGVVSGASFGGFIAVAGMDVLNFTLENKHKFGHWYEIAIAGLRVRRVLKKYTPNFYKKLHNTLLWEIASRVPEEVLNDPAACARLAGQWVGGIGQLAFDVSLTAFDILCKVLLPVAFKGLFKVPAAGEKVAVEYMAAAEKIVAELSKMGASLPVSEGLEIIAEVSEHYRDIEEPLKRFVKILEKST